jgi:hypothetical protein
MSARYFPLSFIHPQVKWFKLSQTNRHILYRILKLYCYITDSKDAVYTSLRDLHTDMFNIWFSRSSGIRDGYKTES